MLVRFYKLKRAVRLSAVCCLLFTAKQGIAQQKTAIDGDVTTYVSIHSAKDISALSMATLYTKKSWCQLRYNYEDTRTFSFYWGRPFVKQGKNYMVQVVPSLGLSAGNFMGVSPSMQLFAEVNDFEFYSSSQTSICVTDLNRSFFFTWTEAQYKFRNILHVGLAAQYLKQYPALQRTNNPELPQAKAQQQLDIGPVIGVQYWRFCLSGYFFNLWQNERHYAVNLTYNFR